MANSFRGSMQTAAKQIFDSFGDLVETATYQQSKPGIYNPASGETNATVKKQNVSVIFMDMTKEQPTLADVVTGDIQALIASKTLSIKPEVNDIVIRNKDEYTVVSVMRDPVDAVITLQLRLK